MKGLDVATSVLLRVLVGGKGDDQRKIEKSIYYGMHFNLPAGEAATVLQQSQKWRCALFVCPLGRQYNRSFVD